MPQPGQLFKPIALKTQRDRPGVSGRKNNIITAITHTTNSKFCMNNGQYLFTILLNII